jgi:adenine phosphoribosyltransferase
MTIDASRAETAQLVGSLLRDVPDFPEPGVLFKDITPLIGDGAALAAVARVMAEPYRDAGLTSVVGLEARGFIFGTAVALELGVGFVPVRKAGKLPAQTVSLDYSLEYGTATIEIHEDAVLAGERVVVVDDVLATGGTAAAAVELLEQVGAEVVAVDVVVELAALRGRERLEGREVTALLTV